MRVVVCSIALGSWYHRGIARMINAFHEKSFGYELQAWVNIRPPGAPSVKQIFNTTGCTPKIAESCESYCAKPFAVQYAMETRADVIVLMDASFYPISNISPIVDFVENRGIFAIRDGFKVGEWATDSALKGAGLTRDAAMSIEGYATGCCGFDVRRPWVRGILAEWLSRWRYIPGPHSNIIAENNRFGNRSTGWCSSDTRCLGSRHDQTLFSLLLGGTTLPPSNLWSYLNADESIPGHRGPSAETVLICDGIQDEGYFY